MVNTILPVSLEGVGVTRRGKRLLGPIDLKLAPDGVTVVLGPNGSGKTTLLRAMHGVERLSSGAVRWAVPETVAQHHQAYVFQTPIMLRRSVAENLAFPLRLVGAPRRHVREEVARWVARLGLEDRASLPAPRLSGGEQQKLALARALIRHPDVLFLDEPCANLDGASIRAIENLLLEARDAGTRIVMTTHDIGQAKRLASDAIFMLHGAVREAGEAAPFFEAPKTSELQSFFRGDIIE
ncbi:MAG: ATP-binding cassette domain-containing protein [Pseudomonadota bacterium]